jgi:phage terminase large subunit-like protein
MPDGGMDDLDRATNGLATQWMRQGWLTVTEGNIVDYAHVYADIEKDAKDFRLVEVNYDVWSGEPVRQALAEVLGRKVPMIPYQPTFMGMTFPLTEFMAMTLDEAWAHHGNPVSRWCFDNVEVEQQRSNPDLIKAVKPQRGGGGKRIDGVISATLAAAGWRARENAPERRPRQVRGF